MRGLLVVLFLLTASCAARPAEEAAAPASVDELRARVAAILAEEHVHGGVGLALVRRDGVEWAGGVGKADVERGVDIDADTLFRVGSITKSFLAIAVMQLVEQGQLDLDAPVAPLVPEAHIDNPWDAARPVTLAHLLEHTAGFDDMHPREIFADADTPLARVLALAPESRRVRWGPGTRYSYANPGYTVAGLLLEKATGRRFEDHLKDAVLTPLGMTTATLYFRPNDRPKLARGYGTWNTPAPPYPLAQRPAGSLVASPKELAHYVEAMLADGEWHGARIVTKASIDRIETCATLPYGLSEQYGLGNYADTEEGFATQGHDGGVDGFSSEARYARAQGFGWVLLWNTTAAGNAEARVRRAVIGYLSRRGTATPKPAPTPAIDLPRETLARYAGYYRFASPRNEGLSFVDSLLGGRLVTLEGGGLVERRFTGPPRTLVATSVDTFRRADSLGPVFRFTADERGRAVLIAGRAYLEKAPYAPVLLSRAVLGAALVWSATALRFFFVRRRRERAVSLFAMLLLAASGAAFAPRRRTSSRSPSRTRSCPATCSRGGSSARRFGCAEPPERDRFVISRRRRHYFA